MASPTAKLCICRFFDDFTRPSGSVWYGAAYPWATYSSGGSPSWSLDGVEGMNRFAQITSSGIYRQSVTTRRTFTDGTLQVVMRGAAGSGNQRGPSLFFRYTDMNNHYRVTLKSSGVTFLNCISGTSSEWGATIANFDVTKWHNVKVQATGSSIGVWVDDVNRFNTTATGSSTPLTGKIGVGVFDSTWGQFSNFCFYDENTGSFNDTWTEFWASDYDISAQARVNVIPIPGQRGGRLQHGGTENRTINVTAKVTQQEHEFQYNPNASSNMGGGYALEMMQARRRLAYLEIPGVLSTSGYMTNLRGPKQKLGARGYVGEYTFDMTEETGVVEYG